MATGVWDFLAWEVFKVRKGGWRSIVLTLSGILVGGLAPLIIMATQALGWNLYTGEKALILIVCLAAAFLMFYLAVEAEW